MRVRRCAVPAVVFAWLALLGAVAVAQAQQGQPPVDFLAYQSAAEAIAQGRTPYFSPGEARARWLEMHALEAKLLAAYAAGRGAEAFREVASGPQLPGPYVYPPSLALTLEQLGVTAVAFTALVLASIAVFFALWLKETRMAPRGLLLGVASLEVTASAVGGNVELILLTLSLVACWLCWHARPIAAAPFIAAVGLVKPFYVVLPLAFVALKWVADRSNLRRALLALALAAALALVEAARWGAALRADALAFFAAADDASWLALPVQLQTPMSAWNRTPLQLLVGLGAGVALALALTLATGLVLFVIAARRVRHGATFGGLFAIALLLLYWVRPVGWGLVYLELVLVPLLWPHASRPGRFALLGAAALLIGTRWVAAVLNVLGAGLPLTTLQTASMPWETALVLPACMAVALACTGAKPARLRGTA